MVGRQKALPASLYFNLSHKSCIKFETGSKLWQYHGDKIMLNLKVVYTRDIEAATQSATRIQLVAQQKNAFVNQP